MARGTATPVALPPDLVELVLGIALGGRCWRTRAALRGVCRELRTRVDASAVRDALACGALTVHAKRTILRLRRPPAWAAIGAAVCHRCSVCGERYAGGFVFDALPLYAHERCIRARSVALENLETRRAERVCDPVLQEAFDALGLPRSVIVLPCSGWNSRGSYPYALVLRYPVPTIAPEASLGGALIRSAEERAGFARLAVERALREQAEKEDAALAAEAKRRARDAVAARRAAARERREAVVAEAFAGAAFPEALRLTAPAVRFLKRESVKPPTRVEAARVCEELRAVRAELEPRIGARLAQWCCEPASAAWAPMREARSWVSPRPIDAHSLDAHVDVAAFRACVMRRIATHARVCAPSDVHIELLRGVLESELHQSHGRPALFFRDGALECVVKR